MYVLGAAAAARVRSALCCLRQVHSLMALLRSWLVASATLLAVTTACERSVGGGCMYDDCCSNLWCDTSRYWDEWCALIIRPSMLLIPIFTVLAHAAVLVLEVVYGVSSTTARRAHPERFRRQARRAALDASGQHAPVASATRAALVPATGAAAAKDRALTY